MRRNGARARARCFARFRMRRIARAVRARADEVGRGSLGASATIAPPPRRLLSAEAARRPWRDAPSWDGRIGRFRRRSCVCVCVCVCVVASFATRAATEPASSPPKLKGITTRPNGRVSVRVSGGGVKQKTVGTFDTLEEALAAYNVEAVKRGVPTQTLPPGAASDPAPTRSRDPVVSDLASATADATETSSSFASSALDFDDTRSALRVDAEVQARHAHDDPDEMVRVVMDMRDPGRWYPAARAMRRQIHLHVGPTNSGKTYAAIQRLKAADSGVYCSPLRLLAWEVAEGLNNAPDGVPCNLVTGQEKRASPGARHVACTVEMADVRRPRDVGVIDEAHLLGDPNRGYAFTRAIMGLPVRELHLCGDPAMVPLVETVAAELGDELVVNRYERLQKLAVLNKPLRRIKDVASGDCLVAFSRRAVHQLKKDVELMAGKRACVIYGSLPPEARARQAELFNDRERSGYDVLIASDAIGMGLNLSIRRVIFTTMRKFDGENLRLLEPPEVKQIAGRAGRFGMGSTRGGATTLAKDQLPLLRAAVEAPVVHLTVASVAPTLDQIALYCEARPEMCLVEALRAFAEGARTSPHYSVRDADDMIQAATIVAHLPLSLEDHWMFAVSPCSAMDPTGAGPKALATFATAFVERGRVSVRVIAAPPARAPRTQGELSILEQAHAAYDLYLWFSLRCPEAFPEHDLAQSLRQTCAAAIELGLQRSASSKLRGGATDADASRLERAKAAVRSETAKLEAAGFGNDSDEDDAFGSVTFSPPRARKPEGESSEPTARGEGDEGDEEGGSPTRVARRARGTRTASAGTRTRASSSVRKSRAARMTIRMTIRMTNRPRSRRRRRRRRRSESGNVGVGGGGTRSGCGRRARRGGRGTRRTRRGNEPRCWDPSRDWADAAKRRARSREWRRRNRRRSHINRTRPLFARAEAQQKTSESHHVTREVRRAWKIRSLSLSRFLVRGVVVSARWTRPRRRWEAARFLSNFFPTSPSQRRAGADRRRLRCFSKHAPHRATRREAPWRPRRAWWPPCAAVWRTGAGTSPPNPTRPSPCTRARFGPGRTSGWCAPAARERTWRDARVFPTRDRAVRVALPRPNLTFAPPPQPSRRWRT